MVSEINELRQIRYFLAVAHASSFRKAADHLNVAQSAISRAIQQLEARLGFQLFERTTRSVRLTPAGEVLYQSSRKAFEQLSQGVHQARQFALGYAGKLNIGYTNFAATGPMSDMIIKFRTSYPDTRVGLQLLGSTEIIEALKKSTIDFGFPLSLACNGSVEHVVISRERFVLLLSASHPLARRGVIPLVEVNEIPLIMGTSDRWSTIRRLINELFARSGLIPTAVEEADDLPVLLQLVSSGAGGLLYGSSIKPSLPPTIVALTISGTDFPIDVSLAWCADNISPLQQSFIRNLSKHSLPKLL